MKVDRKTGVILWSKSIVVALLLSFSMKVVLMILYSPLADRALFFSELWHFHKLWGVLALALSTLCCYKLRIDFKTLFGPFFLALVLGYILAPPVLPNLLKPNYYGVESRFTLDTHPEGIAGVERYDWPLRLGGLYYRDSPELKQEIAEESEYSRRVRTRGFHFWQTGLAYGYRPDWETIPQYNGGGYGFWERLALVVTVGPIALLESLIRGIPLYFVIIMITQVTYFVIRKKHLWWQ